MAFVGRFGRVWRAPPQKRPPFSGVPGNTTLTCDAGSYTLTGQDALFPRDYVLACDVGAYTLTGQDATLTRALKITAETGTYILTGQDVSMGQAIRLTCDAGSYAVTGQDATFSTDPRECPDMDIAVTPDGKQSTRVYPEC